MGDLRKICFIEGISCILLFFVAMPIKYIAEEPRVVSIVGMVHGLLWVGVVFAFLMAYLDKKLLIKQAGLLLFVSTLPLGMFWVDKKLAALEKSNQQ